MSLSVICSQKYVHTHKVLDNFYQYPVTRLRLQSATNTLSSLEMSSVQYMAHMQHMVAA